MVCLGLVCFILLSVNWKPACCCLGEGFLSFGDPNWSSHKWFDWTSKRPPTALFPIVHKCILTYVTQIWSNNVPTALFKYSIFLLLAFLYTPHLFIMSMIVSFLCLNFFDLSQMSRFCSIDPSWVDCFDSQFYCTNFTAAAAASKQL